MARRIPDTAELKLTELRQDIQTYWGFFLEAADRLAPQFLQSFCRHVLEPVNRVEAGDKDLVRLLEERWGVAIELTPQWLQEEWRLLLADSAQTAVVELFAIPAANYQWFDDGGEDQDRWGFSLESIEPVNWGVWRHYSEQASISPHEVGFIRGVPKEKGRKVDPVVRIELLSALLLRERCGPYNPLVAKREDWLASAKSYCDQVEAYASSIGARKPDTTRRDKKFPKSERLTIERDSDWMVKHVLLGVSIPKIGMDYEEDMEAAGQWIDEQPPERMVEKALSRLAQKLGINFSRGPTRNQT